MTRHGLALELRDKSERMRVEEGVYPFSLADLSDDEIIDLWNDTDGHSDQAKLTPRQLEIAIARSELACDFLKFIRFPMLLKGNYLILRVNKPAVLHTLLETRYFWPPKRICRKVQFASLANGEVEHLSLKRILLSYCKPFMEQHEVGKVDIMRAYYH